MVEAKVARMIRRRKSLQYRMQLPCCMIPEGCWEAPRVIAALPSQRGNCWPLRTSCSPSGCSSPISQRKGSPTPTYGCRPLAFPRHQYRQKTGLDVRQLCSWNRESTTHQGCTYRPVGSKTPVASSRLGSALMTLWFQVVIATLNVRGSGDRPVVGLTSPVPVVTFRTPPISVSATLSAR